MGRSALHTVNAAKARTAMLQAEAKTRAQDIIKAEADGETDPGHLSQIQQQQQPAHQQMMLLLRALPCEWQALG